MCKMAAKVMFLREHPEKNNALQRKALFLGLPDGLLCQRQPAHFNLPEIITGHTLRYFLHLPPAASQIEYGLYCGIWLYNCIQRPNN